MTKLETIENFEIKYKKHCFSKNIKITLKQDDIILVTMPYYCSYKKAREFLMSNFEKIKTFQIKKPLLDENIKTKFDSLRVVRIDSAAGVDCVDSVGSVDCVDSVTDRVRDDACNDLKNTPQGYRTQTKRGVVYFYYKGDILEKNNQKALKEAYLKALRVEAKNYLPQRLAFLARKHGFSYQKVSLKNQKTRFGSCSYYNNINLNINLMRYDFDIIDYVLIHELVHTKIKNHSAAFWSEVEKYCPEYKNLRRQLKAF